MNVLIKTLDGQPIEKFMPMSTLKLRKKYCVYNVTKCVDKRIKKILESLPELFEGKLWWNKSYDAVKYGILSDIIYNVEDKTLY